MNSYTIIGWQQDTLWEPVPKILNVNPTFSCLQIVDKQVKQRLITICQRTNSLFMVSYNTKNKAYFEREKLQLTLTRCIKLDWSSCEKVHQTFQKIKTEGIIFIRGSIREEIYFQNKEHFNSVVEAIEHRAAKSEIMNHYQIFEVIGVGVDSIVKRCLNIQENKVYAIKVYEKSEQTPKRKKIQAFINEITLQRKLKHRNILEVKEVFESEHHVFIVSDFLEGNSLLERLTQDDQQKAFIPSYSNISYLMYQLLSAVAYMHSQDVMHRDLKAENIVFRSSGNSIDVVICDFGLAENISHPQELYQKQYKIEKELYQRCGTPGYAAPELLNYRYGDQFYNEKCDIFSLGIIFFFLLCGERPFEGETKEEVMKLNRMGEINYDRKFIKNRTQDTLDLLKKMLQFDPQNRISAQDALSHPYFNPRVKAQYSTSLVINNKQSTAPNYKNNLTTILYKSAPISECSIGCPDNDKFSKNNLNGNNFEQNKFDCMTVQSNKDYLKVDNQDETFNKATPRQNNFDEFVNAFDYHNPLDGKLQSIDFSSKIKTKSLI